MEGRFRNKKRVSREDLYILDLKILKRANKTAFSRFT